MSTEMPSVKSLLLLWLIVASTGKCLSTYWPMEEEMVRMSTLAAHSSFFDSLLWTEKTNWQGAAFLLILLFLKQTGILSEFITCVAAARHYSEQLAYPTGSLWGRLLPTAGDREVKRWMQALWSQFQRSQWRAVLQTGVRCDWHLLWRHQMARGGGGVVVGGLVPMRVRGPCVSPGICSLCQDSGRTVMFGRPSPVSSPQSRGWNTRWARDE